MVKAFFSKSLPRALDHTSTFRQHRQVRTTNRFLRPVTGQSPSRHGRDSTNATRLLIVVSGRSTALQMCLTLLAHECRLASRHRLHMLAALDTSPSW